MMAITTSSSISVNAAAAFVNAERLTRVNATRAVPRYRGTARAGDGTGASHARVRSPGLLEGIGRVRPNTETQHVAGFNERTRFLRCINDSLYAGLVACHRRKCGHARGGKVLNRRGTSAPVRFSRSYTCSSSASHVPMLVMPSDTSTTQARANITVIANSSCFGRHGYVPKMLPRFLYLCLA